MSAPPEDSAVRAWWIKPSAWAARRKSEFWHGRRALSRTAAAGWRIFGLAKVPMFCVCSLQERGRGQMLGIDREGMIVLAFGWLVALAVTLS
jgi:hypothetical protein